MAAHAGGEGLLAAGGAQTAGIFCLHVLVNANNGVLLELAKDRSRFAFSPVLLALLIETVKLVVTVCALARRGATEKGGLATVLQPVTLRGSLRYAVPALLYSFVNSAHVWVFLYLSALEVVVLGQLRILFTAVLSRALLGRRISAIRGLALLILACGAVTCQLGPTVPSAPPRAPAPRSFAELEQGQGQGGVASDPFPALGATELQERTTGYALLTAMCFASALAGVYSEVLLKTTPYGYWTTNLQLYAYGVAINIVAHRLAPPSSLILDTASSARLVVGPLNGFALAYIANQAACGLVVAGLLKFGSALLKLFSAAMSMALLALYSRALGLAAVSAALSLPFLVGSVTVYAALFVFALAAH